VIELLADANLDGHASLLLARLRSDLWREFAEELQVQVLHFEDVGLDRTAPDDVVWRFCQRRGCVLLTANRNRDAEDSLEATIRRESTPDILPVLTFADADRALQSAAYLDRVVETLLTYLLDWQGYRGAGRLYLP
jgi:hypothetical protein